MLAIYLAPVYILLNLYVLRWSYLWIGVGGTNAGKYIRDIGLNSEQLIFRSERGDELKKIVLDMLKHTKMTTSNLYYLQGKLYDFFSILAQDLVIDSYQGSSKENEYGEENGYAGYIKEAMAFIKNEYARGIGVRELADHLNITRSYLYTIFMNELNISPKDFLKKYRVTRARELLSLTDLSVEAIGKSCGYGNSERFARVFKQENGLTPTQFRKSDRNRSRRNLEMSKTELEQLMNS